MKLPDFRLYEPLNRLKAQMGIRHDEYGSMSVVDMGPRLTRDELERLATVGIDVRLEYITVLANGTNTLKGIRVLLYIRDVTQYGNQHHEPKYHLTTCSVITTMHNNGRGQRYVVANRTNGTFDVNIATPAGRHAVDIRLKVCKTCLKHLNFGGFNSLPWRQRQQFVDNFLPEHFFAKYPVSPHTRIPAHDSDGAPLNDYTADFPEISARTRQQAGWRCDACRADLSPNGLHRFLHVHHRDGNRWDNSPHNLRVLCIACHAEEPSHAHLKNGPDYREYRRLRPAR